jgi:PAS domain S-box-containing protein
MLKMSTFLTPLIPEYTLIIPEDTIMLIGWVIGLIGILILSLLLHDRAFKLTRPTLLWSAWLSVLILVATPFIGILPSMSPSLPAGEVPFRHLMFFASVPWMVAGGVLGVLPATILAGMSGLLLAYLDTHNIFTPLVFMSVAVMFSWLVRQRYRTTLFKWLRFPVVASLTSVVLAVPILFIALVLSTPGLTVNRLAFAFSRFPIVLFVLGGMVLIGGVVSVIVQAFAHDQWGGKSELKPGPGETNIKVRLIAYIVPVFVLMLVVVFISSWSFAQRNARQTILGQLSSSSTLAAEGFDVFMETGAQLMTSLAKDMQLAVDGTETFGEILERNWHTLQFFDHLALVDLDGNLVAGLSANTGLDDWPLDRAGEVYDAVFSDDMPLLLPSLTNGRYQAAEVDFVVGVIHPDGQPQGILWGKTDLDNNPYAQIFIQVMDAFSQQGGLGQIVNLNGSILYQTGGEEVIDPIADSTTFATPSFFQRAAEDGQTVAYYVQPVDGTEWVVAVALPAQAIHEAAWQMTYPVVLIILGVMILIFLATWIMISSLVREMTLMSTAMTAVAAGDFSFDHLPKLKSGKGYFTDVLQKMVANQEWRVNYQAKLLSVSNRITGHLNIKDSLHIILAAALTDEASSARMVLSDPAAAMSPDDQDHHLGLGSHARSLAPLDKEIFELSHREGTLVLSGSEAAERMVFNALANFASVLIVPMKWADLRMGVLWVTFPEKLTLSVEEVNYFSELAQLASTAIMNAKTYEDSHASRLLMASVFDLLPDAVLITDQNGQVLFQNRNAQSVLGHAEGSLEGKSLSGLFAAEDLIVLTSNERLDPEAREVQLSDGRVFDVITSPIRINPRQVGKVMILKNTTQQRNDDTLKTEFVTTVSHELRSPLTLILGYAKILRLTGNLNEQQDTYIGNIIDGVEEMKALVQKLLDMGRLDMGEPLDIQTFTADEISRKVIESMDAQAKQKNIQLSVNLPDTEVSIEADQTFLSHALKNLLENAIKFSKMGSDVTLDVRRKEDRVVFVVQDKGIGIAPLDQKNIFKKFGRISAQTGQEQEGSGLGLAIVKSIAERHGGQVWLESQLGKGSTFYFEIPRKQP